MHPIERSLEELAHRLAGAGSDGAALAVAARVVLDLERLTGGELGPVDPNPVTLGRRFARAHRLAARLPASQELAARLRRHEEALGDPLAAVVATWDRYHDRRAGRRVEAPPPPGGCERDHGPERLGRLAG